MPEQRRTALLVEDEPLVRGLLVEILQTANFDVQVAANALEARRVLNRLEPDLALLDIDLGPGANGMDVAHIIDRHHPGTATVFLTKFPDARAATRSDQPLKPGVSFLRKELVGDPAYLLEAIEKALTEQGQVRHDVAPDRPLGMLTNTQLEVLRLVACGFTNAEIARRRAKSVSSVEQMLNTIFKALAIEEIEDVNPRIEAVRIYVQAVGVPSREGN